VLSLPAVSVPGLPPAGGAPGTPGTPGISGIPGIPVLPGAPGMPVSAPGKPDDGWPDPDVVEVPAEVDPPEGCVVPPLCPPDCPAEPALPWLPEGWLELCDPLGEGMLLGVDGD
jgi:preprotein translocase subunit SecD